MKKLIVLFALLLSFSAQAQIADQRKVFLQCSGGTGTQFTTLTLSTGGFVGGAWAVIQKKNYNSGQFMVENPTGVIGIPEYRYYVDVQTKGKSFSLSYNFLNPGSPANVKFKDKAGRTPALPVLNCNEVR